MTKIVQSEGAASKFVLPALLGKDAIKTAQDGIRVSLLTLDAAIHANAVQCLMHAEKHGDTSLMTRLLVDIVDAKSGYRRQGMIQWMRANSPMELNGNTINLSGVDAEGNKRPFTVEKAAQTPFTADNRFAEKVKPVFQDTLLSPLDRMIRDHEAATANTVNGKPVDPTKPYYAGVHNDKVIDFFAKVKELKANLPADATREVFLTRERMAKDAAFVEAHAPAEQEAAQQVA